MAQTAGDEEAAQRANDQLAQKHAHYEREKKAHLATLRLKQGTQRLKLARKIDEALYAAVIPATSELADCMNDTAVTLDAPISHALELEVGGRVHLIKVTPSISITNVELSCANASESSLTVRWSFASGVLSICILPLFPTNPCDLSLYDPASPWELVATHSVARTRHQKATVGRLVVAKMVRLTPEERLRSSGMFSAVDATDPTHKVTNVELVFQHAELREDGTLQIIESEVAQRFKPGEAIDLPAIDAVYVASCLYEGGAPGFTDDVSRVVWCGGLNRASPQSILLNPRIHPTAIRTVRLTLGWRSKPFDLDLQCYLSTGRCVYFSYKYADGVDLNCDSTNGGPETCTFEVEADKKYSIAVLNVSDDAPLAGSGAFVRIVTSAGPQWECFAPASGHGSYWHALTIDGGLWDPEKAAKHEDSDLSSGQPPGLTVHNAICTSDELTCRVGQQARPVKLVKNKAIPLPCDASLLKLVDKWCVHRRTKSVKSCDLV